MEQPSQNQKPLLGILMVICAVFLFASLDTSTKYLTARYDASVVLAVRFLISSILMLVFVFPRHGMKMLRWQRPVIVFVRAGTMALVSLMGALAFRRLPIAESVAIFYLAPFGVLVLSGLVLKEKVSVASWIAATFGFVGLLLIVRPGSSLDPTGVFYAFCAALGLTSYYLLTRLLASSEDTFALLFSTNIVGIVVYFFTLPWTFSGPIPELGDLWVFFVAGSSYLVGHFLLTLAHKETAASVLAPFNYAHLIWAGLLGWLVFDHIPEPLALAGIATITVSGALLAIWTRISSRRRVQTPAP